MCMCYVFHVGEIEKVIVVAKLEAGFAIVEDFDHGRENLDVAWAEDGGRADRGSEKFG